MIFYSTEKSASFANYAFDFIQKLSNFVFHALALRFLSTTSEDSSTKFSYRNSQEFYRSFPEVSNRISTLLWIHLLQDFRNSSGDFFQEFFRGFLHAFSTEFLLWISFKYLSRDLHQQFLRRFSPGIPPGISSGNFS